MKQLSYKTVTLLLLVAFSTTILAQKSTTESFINKAISNFVIAMESNNPGVVESSIFISMNMKYQYPYMNYTKLVNKLNELAANGKTPVIRYKAQLASLYFNYFNIFEDIKFTDKENPDYYFRQISEKLEQQSVAYK
ncbi:hypothetical protein ABRY23_09515 [Melioribacteraceae bacterium 4301-Me]|uniref:hypothetical protein n=1 Tax=Pyranulibacter aquaticus TaxID=3163344 RepID=UPI0035965090